MTGSLTGGEEVGVKRLHSSWEVDWKTAAEQVADRKELSKSAGGSFFYMAV